MKNVNDVNNSKDKKIKFSINKIKKWAVLVFIILIALVGYINYRGEYLEILELGEQYLSIFWQNLSYNIATLFINFIFLFICIYITNKKIKKGLTLFFEDDKKTMPKLPNKSIAFIISIVTSFITSKVLLEKFMLCINATEFGITDVALGFDIGYFIFTQPFIQYMLNYLYNIVIVLTIYAIAYYILVFNLCLDGVDRETLKKSILVKQLCNNIIIIAIIVACRIAVETLNVGLQKILTLQETSPYVLFGAGISEVTIKLWGYRILSIIIVISVIMAVHYFKKNNTRKVINSLLAVPIYFLVMLIVLFGFNTLAVNPDEFDIQQEYIQANIDATKHAFGVDIDEITLAENQTITTEIISQNLNVIDNITIVEKDMVLNNLNLLQTNKGYYTYQNAKIANYNINGKQTLVYISPREIYNSIGTYNNKTYEYTHGYGIIVTNATKTDEDGNINYLQKDFESSFNDVVAIKEPRIYFGLETNDTVVTNSKNKKEFDYPIINSAKAENAENIYEGKAGLKLNFIDRLILSIRENDFKLALSTSVNSQSKILINRNIIERAKSLMPYITYDENPYLVVTDEGKLVWVLDGYTTSNCYPYSQKITLQEDGLLGKTQINYIRNSVKVLIDAYDGTIKFYITDRNDPIIMAYQKMYKDLFAEKDEKIPEDISEQFIYPEYLYNIQAQIIERYHNIQTDVLYRGDDIWQVATHNTSKVLTKSGTEIKPYYTMVKTVDQENSTIGLVLPYTPYQKQNLTAYLIGTYNNEKPKLTLYKYPSNSNILGPMQLDTQIEQDEKISEEINSLNITGTKIKKNMLIVPINNSLLYVEPIYQQYINEENSTLTLKKIVVASGNKVAIGNSLKQALENLVSQYAVDIEIENTDDIEGLINSIIKTNNNLKQSSGNNNWEMVGKDITRLQELITKLENLQKEQNKKEETKESAGITKQ